MRRNKTLIHATTRMNLENMLRGQKQKIVYCWIPFIPNVQNRQILKTEMENRVMVIWGQDERAGGPNGEE